MKCPGEEIVAAGKFPLAAYFGHSYLVTGAFGVSFFDMEHIYTHTLVYEYINVRMNIL